MSVFSIWLRKRSFSCPKAKIGTSCPAGVGARRPVAVFAAGAAAAAAGTAVVGAATTLPVALAGLALAAAGTAVLFPTLVSVLAAAAPDEARGRATPVLATVSYLGFIAGPVYVGLWAGAADLPTAMIALAALGALLAVLAPVVLRSRQAGQPWSPAARAAESPRA